MACHCIVERTAECLVHSGGKYGKKFLCIPGTGKAARFAIVISVSAGARTGWC